MPRRRRGRGEGSISQRPDGLWEAKVSLGYDGDGRRRRKTVYGKSKKEVQVKLREVQNSAATGYVPEKGRITVAQYLTRWLDRAAGERVGRGTWVRYEQLARLRVSPHIGGIQLARLTPLHVEQLFATLSKAGVSARGRQMAGTMLHTALTDAVRLKLIPFNPASAVAKPRPPRPEIQVYDPDQVACFLSAARQDRLYALYLLAVDSGMRQGELFALEWPDVDFGSRSVQVRRALKEVAGKVWVEDLKTDKSRRRIDLAECTLAALQEHRRRQLAEGNAGKLVFTSPEGGFLRRPNLARRSFHPLLKKAGLPRIKFHALRHTCATLLLLADERTKVVSERLGHGNTQTTENCYTHVLPTMQKRAAEKMNQILGRTGPDKASGQIGRS